LSGDSFANLCDYVAYGKDGSRPLNIKKLRRAKKLFVPGHRLDELLDSHFNDIGANVLICGNSDQNFSYDRVLPKSINLWLCQNYAVQNGIGITLPIGLENLRLGKSGFKRFYDIKVDNRNTKKVLLPPMRLTNPVRSQIMELGKARTDLFEVAEEYLDSSQYFKLVSSYKYVIVLEGNGFDTHRLWECLYLGCVPILLHSTWSSNLVRDLALPIIILPNIQSLAELNLAKIENSRSEELERDLIDDLFIPTWQSLINSRLN
jgi:hypothetical protein